MFSKNLQYYRLKKNLTKAALAEQVGVTPMAITHYEKGDRKPDFETLGKLADALGVKKSDFLRRWNENLSFSEQNFRKTSVLSKADQALIQSETEEYFSRFSEILEILGGEVLPSAPKLHAIEIGEEAERDAKNLRAALGLSPSGPVEQLIPFLESKGILVLMLDFPNSAFSGVSGLVNSRPYLALNQNLVPERIRMTICHELAHLLFSWPSEMSEKEREKKANEIAGAFLFPKEDVVEELGMGRKEVTPDMVLCCERYGVSLPLLAVRAKQCGVLSEKGYREYFSKPYSPTLERSHVWNGEPTLFKKLVYRAVCEKQISVEKGAELLQLPYEEVIRACSFSR